MTIFKNGCYFFFNVSAIKCCFLDLTIINYIGSNDLSLKKGKFDILNLKNINRRIFKMATILNRKWQMVTNNTNDKKKQLQH